MRVKGGLKGYGLSANPAKPGSLGMAGWLGACAVMLSIRLSTESLKPFRGDPPRLRYLWTALSMSHRRLLQPC